MLPMPFSCSAIYPIWFPCASMITYLLACSNPLLTTFISMRQLPEPCHLHHHVHQLQLPLHNQPGVRQEACRRVRLLENGIWVFWDMDGGEEGILSGDVVRIGGLL